MKNIFILLIIAALGWYGYGKYKAMGDAELQAQLSPPGSTAGTARTPVFPAPPQFTCDGRTHCSEMTSCAEATYFVKHCPNTEMDGNNDGVPCEKQWCN